MREQYRLSTLAGDLQTHGLYRAGPREGAPAVSANVIGEAWEVSLEVFGSTYDPSVKASFENLLENAQDQFETWLAPLPKVATEFTEARELAGYVMYASVVAPSGLFKRPVMLMSKNWMDYVWSWDQLFLTHWRWHPGHEELAWDQLLLMADQQDVYGAYPDAYNDQHAIYNFSKPPVHGLTTLELLKRSTPTRSYLTSGLRIAKSLDRLVAYPTASCQVSAFPTTYTVTTVVGTTAPYLTKAFRL